jgi:hypothetical protein
MLFQKKNKKAFQVIWAILSILMIVSMVVLYLPGLFS